MNIVWNVPSHILASDTSAFIHSASFLNVYAMPAPCKVPGTPNGHDNLLSLVTSSTPPKRISLSPKTNLKAIPLINLKPHVPGVGDTVVIVPRGQNHGTT